MARGLFHLTSFSLLLGLSSTAISALGIPGVPATSFVAPVFASETPSKGEQTLLSFETVNYRVRVFKAANQLFLSVYNKETGYTDLNQVPAQQLPPEDSWQTYVNQRGDLYYFARVSPSGETSLEIRVPGDNPAQPEAGFNATYSFPHSYLGQDIDTTVAALVQSGWVVNEQVEDAVALSASRQSLDLRFNPDTGRVTYTHLEP